MRRIVLAAATLCVLPLLGQAEDGEHRHDHPGMQAAASGDVPIKVTINPEGRISAVLAGALPPPVTCGTAADFPVKIVNDGFVTARLEAQWVGEAPPGATLDFQPEPLTGAPEEIRMLRITLANAVVTDLTIAFKARHQIPDVGDRHRVHFLMRCLQSPVALLSRARQAALSRRLGSLTILQHVG